MKRVAIIFLVFILLIQCSVKMALVVYYQLNKDYVTANFCENKSNIELKCNGKCYLNKKIKTQDEAEKNIPSILKGFEELVLFTPPNISFAIPLSVFQERIEDDFYTMKQYTSPTYSIFQPPQ